MTCAGAAGEWQSNKTLILVFAGVSIGRIGLHLLDGLLQISRFFGESSRLSQQLFRFADQFCGVPTHSCDVLARDTCHVRNGNAGKTQLQ